MTLLREIFKTLVRLPQQDPKQTARNRLALPTIITTAAFLMVGMQLITLSAGKAQLPFKYAGITQNILPKNSSTKKNQRGKIYDRQGRILATTLPAYELYADPHTIIDPRRATLQLSDLLPHMTEEEILIQLTRDGRYAELSWRVSPALYETALKRGIVGVYGRPRATRFYPKNNEAAHILGIVNKNNQGIAGVEQGLNQHLAHGTDIHLSIDITAQAILREEIQAQITQFQAIGGAGIVMDVQTGEIIAMVSLPDYNANHYAQASSQARFNRATKGVYEMGSTFKIMNTAIALDSGLFNVDDLIDVVSPLEVEGRSIKDYKDASKPLNVAEIMVVSSNKGAARIADRLGAQRQKQYLKALGMLDRLQLEIPEVAQPITPYPWQRLSTMTVAYGHGISVTITHLAAAVASTIGDGTRISPSLIKGGLKPDYHEHIFKPETTQKIRAIMRRVITHEHGTGKFADIQGYVVGGKTGTAEKIINGKYVDLNIVSFVAAFPAHDPQYVVAVLIDEPHGQKSSQYQSTSGWVAAPAVGRFIERTAPLLNVAPSDENAPQIRPALEIKSPQLDAQTKNTPEQIEVQNASY